MRTGLIRSIAVALILAGLILGARVGYNVFYQQAKESDQDKAWKTFVTAAAGQGKADAAAPTPGATSLGGGLFLRLTVPKLNKDGVAVNGDWNDLNRSSMVHYRDSPPPGQKGNMLIAFHRETHWLDINGIGAGDMLQIQTVDGKTYDYKIDFVKVVKPSDVSLLKPTDGLDATLITCDPPWQDYNRMMFRAHLVGPASPRPS
jgi:LPXTG-site transpeptidase (sortase) family protein